MHGERVLREALLHEAMPKGGWTLPELHVCCKVLESPDTIKVGLGC